MEYNEAVNKFVAFIIRIGNQYSALVNVKLLNLTSKGAVSEQG